jgi:hypothetical protein
MRHSEGKRDSFWIDDVLFAMKILITEVAHVVFRINVRALFQQRFRQLPLTKVCRSVQRSPSILRRMGIEDLSFTRRTTLTSPQRGAEHTTICVVWVTGSDDTPAASVAARHMLHSILNSKQVCSVCADK